MTSFENKVALVTGAGSGLGLATANAFARSGAAVVLADWNEASVASAARTLTAEGHKALAVACDVADDAQVKSRQLLVARRAARRAGARHLARSQARGSWPDEKCCARIRRAAFASMPFARVSSDITRSKSSTGESAVSARTFWTPALLYAMSSPSCSRPIGTLFNSDSSYVTGQSISVDGGFVMR